MAAFSMLHLQSHLWAVDVTLAEVVLVAEVRSVDGARLVTVTLALLAHLQDLLLDLITLLAAE